MAKLDAVDIEKLVSDGIGRTQIEALEGLSSGDLYEIANKMREAENLKDKPKPLTWDEQVPNIQVLRNLVDRHIDSLARNVYLKDIREHIYEKAVEAFYGEDVWKWINKHELDQY